MSAPMLIPKISRTWVEIQSAMEVLLLQLDHDALNSATPRVVAFRADFITRSQIRCDAIELLAYKSNVAHIFFIKDAIEAGGYPPLSLQQTFHSFMQNRSIVKVGFNILQNITRFMRSIHSNNSDCIFHIEKTNSALCLSAFSNATAMSAFAGSDGTRNLICYAMCHTPPMYRVVDFPSPIGDILQSSYGWSTKLLDVNPELFARMIIFVTQSVASALHTWRCIAFGTLPIGLNNHAADSIPVENVKEAILGVLKGKKRKQWLTDSLIRETKKSLTNSDIDLTRSYIMEAIAQLENDQRIFKREGENGTSYIIAPISDPQTPIVQ